MISSPVISDTPKASGFKWGNNHDIHIIDLRPPTVVCIGHVSLLIKPRP